jgi:hypothetical protein
VPILPIYVFSSALSAPTASLSISLTVASAQPTQTDHTTVIVATNNNKKNRLTGGRIAGIITAAVIACVVLAYLALSAFRRCRRGVDKALKRGQSNPGARSTDMLPQNHSDLVGDHPSGNTTEEYGDMRQVFSGQTSFYPSSPQKPSPAHSPSWRA